ncbi:MAG: sugar phosphate isomerase/epimerase family protein [Patescibacteria group bacterium]
MKNIVGVIQGRLSRSEELMFFPSKTWAEEFAAAEKVGFNAIEWGFCEKDWKKNPILSENGIAKIRQLMKKYKIQIPSVCAYFFIDSGFAGAAVKSSDMLNRLIQQGSKIGAERILIPFLGDSEIKNQKEKKEIIKNLKPCLKKAESFNIELAFETSLGAAELREFIEQFKHPLVKVYYDTGNRTTFVGNKVPQEIRALKGLISGAHIKDRKFGATASYPLGKGSAVFPEIFKAFGEIKFKGPFILEAARVHDFDEITLNKGYLSIINKFLKK